MSSPKFEIGQPGWLLPSWSGHAAPWRDICRAPGCTHRLEQGYIACGKRWSIKEDPAPEVTECICKPALKAPAVEPADDDLGF